MQGSVRRHRDKWQARYKVKDVKTGRWHEVTKTHPTRREAEAWLRHTTAEFGLEARGARTMTVNELLDEWWDHVAFDWSPNTRFAQTYTVNKLRKHLGSITLAKLSTRDIDRFIAHERKAGLRPTTIQREIGVLRQAMRQAIAWDYILVDPSQKCRLPKNVKAKPKPITPDQIEALIAESFAHSTEFGTLVYLAVSSGCRRGELLALRWSDIDFDTGDMTVARAVAVDADKTMSFKLPKNNQERIVPLGESTLAVLKAHRARQRKDRNDRPVVRLGDGLLFTDQPGTDIAWRPDYVTMMFGRFRNRLDLRHIHFHSLRHYCTSRLVLSGLDVVTIAERMGHNPDGRMTLGVYAHSSDERGRDAGNIIDAELAHIRIA